MLLTELNQMTHDQRVRRMVELGREALDNPDTEQFIDELEQGNVYERYLALVSCYTSRDADHVMRALHDPSRLIRGLALSLVPLTCNDAQTLTAFKQIHPSARYRFLTNLRKKRRYSAIDACLASLDDKTVMAYAALGSEDFARKVVARFVNYSDHTIWRRLARRHPDLAIEALLKEVNAAKHFDQRLAYLSYWLMPTFTELRPEKALQLARALLRHTPIERLNLHDLAVRFPNEISEMLLSSDDRAHIPFKKSALRRLTTDNIIRLIERRYLSASAYDFILWYARLKSEQRGMLYEVLQQNWWDHEGKLSPNLIALLPRDMREAEARRHLALPALATRIIESLAYAAFLSWDEAREYLVPYFRNADATIRAAALSALIRAVGYHRDQLGEVLKLVKMRRNEQDPVRLAMLTALSSLKPGIWREEHLDDLGQIIRDALDAADLSHTTASNAEKLIVILLPFHPLWSAEWLATLVKERGQVSFYALANRLNRRDIEMIAPALMPILEAWRTRERERFIIAAAQAFGKRLRYFTAFIDLLEKLLDSFSHPWVGAQALQLIKSAEEDHPIRFPRLVVELLAKDKSWVTQPIIHQYLHRRRQDLLTPYLGQTSYSGRFSTGKTRYILPIFRGFYRWTPEQQHIFAGVLSEVTADTMRDTPAMINTINQLAGLIAVEPVRLIELASAKTQVIRDTALRALGRLDAGQGVPVLLDAMNDDRARIAIYALRRTLLEQSADSALNLLRKMPLDKVTVAKEVVRLIGDLGTEEAYQELLNFDGRDLHSDVRVALVRAMWSFLERPTTWDMLKRAAQSPDLSTAALTARTPAEKLSPAAQRQLVETLVLLMRHPIPAVRVTVLERCTFLPVSDPDRLMITPILEAARSPLPDEMRQAAAAIFATYGGKDAALVGETVTHLLPYRWSLTVLIDTLKNALRNNRGQLMATTRAVLTALRQDPLTVSLQVSLAIHGIWWKEVAAFLVDLSAHGELHAEAIMQAVAAMPLVLFRSDVGEAWQMEEALRVHPDPMLRRIGVAVLKDLVTAPRGWTDRDLEVLNVYRNDPSPLVAEAAQFTFPVRERI